MADARFGKPILLPGAPSLPLHAATKDYVDALTAAVVERSSDQIYPIKEGYGYHSATGDPLLVSTAYVDVPGHISRIWVPRGCEIASVGILISAAGTLGAGGLNGIAIYSDDGEYLASTASDTTIWTTVGLNVRSLTTTIPAQDRGRFVWAMVNIEGFNPTAARPYITGREDAFNVGPRRRAAHSTTPVSSWPASIDPDTWGSGTHNFVPFIVLGGTVEDIVSDIYETVKYLPVANGTHFNGNGGSTVTGLPQVRCRQTRKLLRVIAPGANELQLEWANKYTSNDDALTSCEVNGPNNVTVRMSVEYPAGNPRMVSGSANYAAATAYVIGDQVNSGGSSWVCIQAGTGQTPAVGSAYWRKVNRYLVRWIGDNAAGDIVFAPGDYKKSIPIALLEELRVGDMIAVLGAYDTGSATNRVPYAGHAGACNTVPFVDWVVDAAGGMPAAGASLADTGITNQTNGNTTTANSIDTAAWMKIPYATAITGNIPDERCIGLFGDSMIQGSGDEVTDGELSGPIVRALDGMPRWRVAQGGNKANCYTYTNAPWQFSCLKRCSSIITCLSMNDLQTGKTTAQMKTIMERLWRILSSLGPPVFQTLPTPISTSTDAWATTANQGQWLTGGSGQFPSSDASYLTSVYGLISMWLSQDGAEVTNASGGLIKAGERGHPLSAIIDARAMMADPETSWKWTAGYTADGAHANALSSKVQAAYLKPTIDTYVGGGSYHPPHAWPPFHPAGIVPCESMPRSSAKDLSATPTTGSIVTVLGVSSGRQFYGVRWMTGTAVASTRHWTLLVGLDPTKMKVIASGNFSESASTMQAVGIPNAPYWIPAGYLVALVKTTPAANALYGANVGNLALNRMGNNYVVGGNSTATAALTGTVNLRDAAASGTRFAAHIHRAWAEVY